MILTAQDFNIPPYEIDNLDQNELEPRFSEWMDNEERRILRRVLGLLLYEALDAAITALGATPDLDTLDVKWKDILFGKRYKHTDGYSYYQEGLFEALRHYIYSSWTRVRAELNTGIGVNISNGENSTITSPSSQIVLGFNSFLDIIGSSCELEDSLCGFLYNSGNTYFDIVEEEYTDIKDYVDRLDIPERINVFGL